MYWSGGGCAGKKLQPLSTLKGAREMGTQFNYCLFFLTDAVMWTWDLADVWFIMDFTKSEMLLMVRYTFILNTRKKHTP